MAREIKIEKSLKLKENEFAEKIRKILKRDQVFMINVMGSPGSGKTTFIKNLVERLGKKKVLVIQGDLESDIDKKFFDDLGVSCLQINTHSGCHLFPNTVYNQIKNLDLKKYDYLIVENVGNLVCPASIDLGQNLNILISSVPEGSDKAKKYQHIFHYSQILVLTKIDLIGPIDFDKNQFIKDAKKVNNGLLIFKVSEKERTQYKKIVSTIEKTRKLSA